jgi:hypothetical protein
MDSGVRQPSQHPYRPHHNLTAHRTTRLIRVRTEDNVFQHLEVLKDNRTKRHRDRELLVEGVRPLNQACAHHWRFKSLVYAAERALSDWARRWSPPRGRKS